MTKIIIELSCDGDWDKDSTNCLWDWLEEELIDHSMAMGKNIEVDDVRVA